MIQNGVEDTLVLDAKRRLSSAPELLQRHSLRMAALADALADRENLDVDRAGLFCACVFHDLGLLVAGRAPFPVRSAGLLEAFLTEHDVAPARVAPLVTAVRRHLVPPVSLPRVPSLPWSQLAEGPRSSSERPARAVDSGRTGSARHTEPSEESPAEVSLLRGWPGWMPSPSETPKPVAGAASCARRPRTRSWTCA